MASSKEISMNMYKFPVCLDLLLSPSPKNLVYDLYSMSGLDEDEATHGAIGWSVCGTYGTRIL